MVENDKYSGYWKEKGEKLIHIVSPFAPWPRWRRAKTISFSENKWENNRNVTVDFLRTKCEKITEKEYKFLTT